MTLKLASKTCQELIAGGKTPEELPQALGEALKVEGDRLSFLINALEILGTKLEDLKRMVVYGLLEGEKPPGHLTQKGEHYYLVEYYPSLNKKAPAKDEPRKGGKEKGKRGGRRGKGNNDRRGPRDGQRTAHRTPQGPAQARPAPAGGGPVRLPKPRDLPVTEKPGEKAES